MSSASIGNPQSLNMYAYVENNPIDFVDPSGLFLDDDGHGGGDPASPDEPSGPIEFVEVLWEDDPWIWSDIGSVLMPTIFREETGGGGIVGESPLDCSKIESESNRLTNLERKKQGLKALTLSNKLIKIARERAQEEMKAGTTGHNGFRDALKRNNQNRTSNGENVGRLAGVLTSKMVINGQYTKIHVIKTEKEMAQMRINGVDQTKNPPLRTGFMNSDAHRENLLNKVNPFV